MKSNHHSTVQRRSELRRKILARRSACHKDQASLYSAQAQKFLLDSELWQTSTSVALYVPIRGEIGTSLLVNCALNSGKKLYLPKMLDKTHFAFIQCNEPALCQPGIFGIPEPPCGDTAKKLDLVIVPGVVFDKHGYRLGYGAGCYDRALAQPNASQATLIGLCFAFQTVPDISPLPWDIPMHGICTEEGLS